MRSILGLCAAALVVVGGCSSSSTDSASGGPKGSGATTTATIGASGGVLSGPDGVILSVPPGALTADTTISVTSTSDAPPASFSSWSSPIYSFTPDGLSFGTPAMLIVPFTGNPTTPTLYWSSDKGATFGPLPSSVVGPSVSTSITALGRGFVGAGAGGTPPGGGPCDPYVGSYAGILAFHWVAYDTPSSCASFTPRSGTGTITVHFTATCLGPSPSGSIVLNVTTVSTDNTYFATPNPTPADPAFSQMDMPPNPPTTGTGAISLGFQHGYLGLGPTVTVTSGAAKIASDVGDTKGWLVGTVSGDPDNAAFVAAGMPSDSCVMVDSKTFKVDKL